MSKRPASILNSPAHTVVWKRRRLEEGIPDLWLLPDVWIAHVRPLLSIVDRARLRWVNRHFYDMDNAFVLATSFLQKIERRELAHPLLARTVYFIERIHGLTLLFESACVVPVLPIRCTINGGGCTVGMGLYDLENQRQWFLILLYYPDDRHEWWLVKRFVPGVVVEEYYEYILRPTQDKTHRALFDALLATRLLDASLIKNIMHPFLLPYGRFTYTNDKRRITPTTDPYSWPADEVY